MKHTRMITLAERSLPCSLRGRAWQPKKKLAAMELKEERLVVGGFEE
jgi:hypothetical protein